MSKTNRMTAAEKKSVNREIAKLDTGKLLQGLGRSQNRSGGFPLLQPALQSQGFNLAMVSAPMNGDSGTMTLRIERDGEEVENVGIGYSWHWMGNGYEIVAYIS
jgi:hypothetical protein